MSLKLVSRCRCNSLYHNAGKRRRKETAQQERRGANVQSRRSIRATQRAQQFTDAIDVGLLFSCTRLLKPLVNPSPNNIRVGDFRRTRLAELNTGLRRPCVQQGDVFGHAGADATRVRPVIGRTTRVGDKCRTGMRTSHRVGNVDHACRPGGWAHVGDIGMQSRPLLHLNRLAPVRFQRSSAAC